MGWYGEHVLPAFLDVAMDTAQNRRIRARVTADLAGKVLEVDPSARPPDEGHK